MLYPLSYSGSRDIVLLGKRGSAIRYCEGVGLGWVERRAETGERNHFSMR